MGRIKAQFITKFIGLLSLIFLIVYASAQFVSGGKTLMVIFDWDLWLGIGIGSVIVFMYTMVGGIRASIWTDVDSSNYYGCLDDYFSCYMLFKPRWNQCCF